MDQHRSLARFATDVEELLVHLGLRTTVVMGESGGGPHALVLAHDLAPRVSKALVVSGVGPGAEDWALEGMMPLNRRMMLVGRHAPWLLRLPMAVMGRTTFNAKRPDGFMKLVSRTAPACDLAFYDAHPEVVRLLTAGAADGFRQGSRGAAQEFAMFARPWHFRIEDISVPVVLWHGTEDLSVPVATAMEIARRLPSSQLHIIEGRGHMAGLERLDEIVAAVTG